MGIEFAWFYDALAVIIVIVCIYIGGKRGFLRSAVMLLGYAVSLVLAVIAANEFAPYVYDNYIKDEVVIKLEENLTDVDVINEMRISLNNKYGKYGVSFSKNRVNEMLTDDKDKTAQNIIDFIYDEADFTLTAEDSDGIIGTVLSDRLNEKAREYIPTVVFGNGVDMNDEGVWKSAVNAIKGDSRMMAEFIEEYFVREPLMSILSLSIMILTFCILIAIINIVLHALKVVDKIPVINAINAFFGGVMGAVQGIVTVLVIALAVRLLIAIGGADMLVFNTDTINITYIFRIFYYFSI